MASKLRGEKDESQAKYIVHKIVCVCVYRFSRSRVFTMLHQSLTQSDQTRDGYQTNCIMSFYRLRNAKSQKEISNEDRVSEKLTFIRSILVYYIERFDTHIVHVYMQSTVANESMSCFVVQNFTLFSV